VKLISVFVGEIKTSAIVYSLTIFNISGNNSINLFFHILIDKKITSFLHPIYSTQLASAFQFLLIIVHFNQPYESSKRILISASITSCLSK